VEPPSSHVDNFSYGYAYEAMHFEQDPFKSFFSYHPTQIADLQQQSLQQQVALAEAEQALAEKDKKIAAALAHLKKAQCRCLHFQEMLDSPDNPLRSRLLSDDRWATLQAAASAAIVELEAPPGVSCEEVTGSCDGGAEPEDQESEKSMVSFEASLSRIPAQDPTLPSDAVWKAIAHRETVRAAALLSLPHPPGLNIVKTGKEISTLHMAVYVNLPDIALAIISRPDFVHVNAKRKPDGATALHLAAFKGHVQVCQALLGRSDFVEAGARLVRDWGTNKAGDTALDVAKGRGRNSIIQLLDAWAGSGVYSV